MFPKLRLHETPMAKLLTHKTRGHSKNLVIEKEKTTLCLCVSLLALN